MKAETLAEIIGAEFYAGVPDSQLKALCDFLMDAWGTDPRRHIIAANEGNAAAIAAGYHLATGKIPAVYLQNSGQGNIINPAASLLSDRVYGIPVIFIIGWRGEPGVPDEPQHVHQGAVTLKLLEDMDIRPFVIGQSTTDGQVRAAMSAFRPLLASGKSVAFVVRKGALAYDGRTVRRSVHPMSREEAIAHITAAAGAGPVVSTTGKASRELFEIRERNGQGHGRDFLTVGSMGHASSIALGLALQRPDRLVWCVDGDGAALMHLGALAVIGTSGPANLVHIVINNAAHESVGGMPTAAGGVDLPAIARACGYRWTASADTPEGLDAALDRAAAGQGPYFIEAKCALGARKNLGRPSSSPQENKRAFMEHLGVKSANCFSDK